MSLRKGNCSNGLCLPKRKSILRGCVSQKGNLLLWIRSLRKGIYSDGLCLFNGIVSVIHMIKGIYFGEGGSQKRNLFWEVCLSLWEEICKGMPVLVFCRYADIGQCRYADIVDIFLVHPEGCTHLIEQGSYQTSLERWKRFFPFLISFQPIMSRVYILRHTESLLHFGLGIPILFYTGMYWWIIWILEHYEFRDRLLFMAEGAEEKVGGCENFLMDRKWAREKI